jgi:serine/threonine-protein kinase
MRCIEKHPADRPMSADAVAEELIEFVRQRTEVPMRQLVRGALASARLVSGEVPSLVRASEPRMPLAVSPWSVAPFGVALVLALAVIHATDRNAVQAAAATEGPLVPAKPGFLRVLAAPWAEVAIDGQRAAITPVARAIPLAPGVHFVTFTHPSAPSQTRRVTIATDATETLDVTMDVAGAVRDAGLE